MVDRLKYPSFTKDRRGMNIDEVKPVAVVWSQDSEVTAPYTITPHDNNALPKVPRGIYVGTGGDVVLRGVDGSADVTYKNLPNASYIAVRASHVRAAGTTASNLVAEV